MLLAEALNERAGMTKQVQQLTGRIAAVARYQEGDLPAEDAEVLLGEARRQAREVGDLVRRINGTNSHTYINVEGVDMTITDGIALRDAIGAEWQLVSDAAAQASGGRGGFMYRQLRTELRMITALPVAFLRTQADDLARRRRQLDTIIQQANWVTRLQD